MSEEAAPDAEASDERNIRIHLSDKATLKAVRVDSGFHILVGDDVEIRGVTPDHMRSLVGSVMDAYLPADMASRILNGWGRRRAARTSESEDAPDRPDDPPGEA